SIYKEASRHLFDGRSHPSLTKEGSSPDHDGVKCAGSAFPRRRKRTRIIHSRVLSPGVQKDGSTSRAAATEWRNSVMKWKVLSVFALGVACLATAAIEITAQKAGPESLSIARQGYLFAGGKYSAVNERRVIAGQL